MEIPIMCGVDNELMKSYEAIVDLRVEYGIIFHSGG